MDDWAIEAGVDAELGGLGNGLYLAEVADPGGVGGPKCPWGVVSGSRCVGDTCTKGCVG